MDAVLSLPGMFRVYTQSFYRPDDATLREKSVVVGVVALLHLSVFLFWWFSPEPPMVLVNEMSISFANIQMQQAEVTPKPIPKPRDPDPAPVEEVVKEEAPPEPQVATPPSPVQLDAEPDYRADYLNNPKPPYPMVARRMGYHGTVILDVEVMAEGRAGDIVLYKSSGFDILDKAALQTVKTWRFVPARHFGQAVTQRFLVPIKFSLEDEA